MRRALFCLLLVGAIVAALCARGETLEERYWRTHRERATTTRYGEPPTAATNAAETVSGDLVLVCDGFVDNTYGYTLGPLTGKYRFSVPFETDMGWTGYALEGETTPKDMADLASRSIVICDPATGGNLVMLWGPDLHEHARIVGIESATPEIYPFDGSYSGTVALTREPPVPTTVLPYLDRDTVRGMLAPPPPVAQGIAGGALWIDALVIPEGNWLCECPVAGTSDKAWRAALCPPGILRALVWRHATGIAPTNLPVTIEHDPARVIGRVEGLYYEAGTGVVARLSVTPAGWDWAKEHGCDHPSPDVRAMYTNLVVNPAGWIHEHQDYIDARCVPRGEDMSAVTNVPTGVTALVMAPVYLRGVSLVKQPLLPTYVEAPVGHPLRDAYPTNPRKQWSWR